MSDHDRGGCGDRYQVPFYGFCGLGSVRCDRGHLKSLAARDAFSVWQDERIDGGVGMLAWLLMRAVTQWHQSSRAVGSQLRFDKPGSAETPSRLTSLIGDAILVGQTWVRQTC